MGRGRSRREVRTKEAQEVVRPVQVGGRRQLVLQRVVVWSELPAQHLRQSREAKRELLNSGCLGRADELNARRVDRASSVQEVAHLVELVVPAALQSVERPAALSARRRRQRRRRAAVHRRL